MGEGSREVDSASACAVTGLSRENKKKKKKKKQAASGPGTVHGDARARTDGDKEKGSMTEGGGGGGGGRCFALLRQDHGGSSTIYVELLFALWRQQLVGRLASIC